MRYDLIRIPLISLYTAALLGPPLSGPYLLTQRPCLDLRCQALTYLLTYEAAMLAAELSHLLHLRFFGERMAYADSFGWAFARRMSSCSACVALSVRTCASFLAMPRLRAERTVFLAR